MSQIQFTDLKLIDPIQKALKDAGYITPTPIQGQSITPLLEGNDLLGIAQTGTGKTAAFSLPILQLLNAAPGRPEPKRPRALILTPTRELAIQIHESLRTYGKYLKLRHAVIFGGVSQGQQVRDLNQGPDVLVATPGRLLDLVEQRLLRLDRVEIFVLDEADRMLDMGFMRDIKKILPLIPTQRQTIFFSATMPKEIQSLAETILKKNPVKVEITPQATTVEKIQQTVMFVEKKSKVNLLVHFLRENPKTKVIVFVEMKHQCNKVADRLKVNGINADTIHGNKSQTARQKAIENFSKNRTRVLIATDIASRGIDIDGITHVINYDLPNIPESYVHRIGRTARAGAEGKAISFCTADEKSYLRAIEKATRQEIPVTIDHPYHSEESAQATTTSVGKAKARIEGARKPSGSRRPHKNQRRHGGGGGNKGGGGFRRRRD
ncbi:MAG: DEAD/DEAH box helicase [Bacteriovoracaceae bacterium]|nr:DEAD/DEAH box helicase [Bacteriovoracaceae bacterium]